MANKNQIGLEAIFDDEEFQKGLNSYNSGVSDASEKTEEAAEEMTSVWDLLASGGAMALEAIAIGVSAFAAELYLAVDAALETEEVLTRVDFVVSNVAERTGVASEEVFALADSLSQVVPIDDEVIAQAIAMGLTFDGVNENNIQPLIAAAADLATWTGHDLPGTMKTLARAISDPDQAMRLFKEANITLTEEQEKTLKALGKTGDTAATTEFILEQLANKGILGLGEAMGDTAKGKMTVMQTAIGNLQESLGTGLLDALGGVFDRITEFATDPRTIEFFTDLGEKIGDFISELLDRAPDMMTTIEEIGDWFKENKPLIVGILAALGVAIAAFAVTVITSAISAAAALAPILIAMALIGAGAALLYTAWTENWGGVQEHVAALWQTIQPIFESLIGWLQVNVPIALEYLSTLWTTILLPAIQEVFAWVVANLIPLFISWVEWLQINVPAAIQTLSDFWNNILLPAIQKIWSWISVNLIPLFKAIANLMNAVLSLAIRALAGLWQNVLLPAIQAVGNWISENILPVFQDVADYINETVMPALEPFATFLENVLKKAFEGITEAIQFVIEWINTLIDAINNIELPPWLTPGSPTPFELGLKGINEQLKRMAGTTLPKITQELNVLSTVRDVPGANGAASAGRIVNSSNSVHNYLFGARFSVNNSNGLNEILSGLS